MQTTLLSAKLSAILCGQKQNLASFRVPIDVKIIIMSIDMRKHCLVVAYFHGFIT